MPYRSSSGEFAHGPPRCGSRDARQPRRPPHGYRLAPPCAPHASSSRAGVGLRRSEWT
jgi:hypothetical protein